MTKQKKLIYIGLALVLYVLIIAFPTYLFTKDMLILTSVELGLRVAYLAFIILFSYFTRIGQTYTGPTKLRNFFLLLPMFFVAFVNTFYLGAIAGSKFTFVINPFTDIINGFAFLSLIVTAVEEVLLFGYLVQKNLTFAHKLVRIFVAAAIFAITHVFVMLYSGLGIIKPLDLFDVLFKFGIGIILGVLYEYTNNLAVPVTFNIIYTISNEMLYKVTISSNPHWSYYVTVACFAVGGALYLLTFYFFMLKKEER